MHSLSKMGRPTTLLLSCAMLTLTLLGCGGSKPARFYGLTAMPDARTRDGVSRQDGISVGIDGFQTPDYLARPQIVIKAENRIEFSEYERWGEDLQLTMGRVVRENLSVLLNTDNIILFPWPAKLLIDVRLGAVIVRFEADESGTVHLVARYSISDADPTTARGTFFSHSIPTEQPDKTEKWDYNAIAAAMSEALAALSRSIAETIRESEYWRE